MNKNTELTYKEKMKANEDYNKAKQRAIRYGWAKGLNGGTKFIYVNHDLKIVLEGHSSATKSDMTGSTETAYLKRLRDLNAERDHYTIREGYELAFVDSLSYKALRILNSGNRGGFTWDELKAMEGNYNRMD